MAKFTKKVMGKEVGAAEVYAQPHNMEGGATNVNTYSVYTPGAKVMDTMNMSVGGISKGNYAKDKPIRCWRYAWLWRSYQRS